MHLNGRILKHIVMVVFRFDRQGSVWISRPEFILRVNWSSLHEPLPLPPVPALLIEDPMSANFSGFLDCNDWAPVHLYNLI